MKYIRTKNGNILNMNEIHIPYQVVIGNLSDFTGALLDLNSQGRFEILKQADTIEELCDEYVVKHINMLTPMLIDKFTISLKDIKTQYSGNDNFEYIYGAIWTDKGLIYVAKMNNKGELELL